MNDKELLDLTLQHLTQAIDMLDVMEIACTSLDHSSMIGPLNILKRDFLSLYQQIDEALYSQ